MSQPAADNTNVPDAPRVLIADGSEEVIAAVAAAVEKQLPDAKIVIARKGEDARALLMDEKIDAVVIDMSLPGISGAEVIAQVRREGRRPFLVLTSAVVLPHWAVLSTELNAYEYIKKPFMPEDMENLLLSFRRMRQPTRILIADAGDQTRSMMRKIVNSSRFASEIQETDNGGYALKLARMKPFDLALIDAHLNGVSGLETACQLQSLHPQTTVVSILPLNDRTLSQSLKHLGLSHSLQKPFFTRDVDVLLHTIHGLRRPYLMNAVLKAAAALAS